MNREVQEMKLLRVANAYNFVEMWQCSQNLRSTQKTSYGQNKQMAAFGYISDTEGTINAAWSNCQRDGGATFKLSETSSLQPAVTANNLAGGQTHVFNVCQNTRIHRHLAKSDEDCAPDIISDTGHSLNWTGTLGSPN